MSNREKLTSVISAIFVGILCDRVLFSGLIGLGFSLLMFSLVLLCYIMLGDRLQVKGNKGLIFLIPLFIIIIRSTIYDNQPIHALNILIIPFLMTAVAIVIWFKDVKYFKFIFFMELFGHLVLYPLVYLGKPFSVIKERFFSEKIKTSRKINPQILAGIIISIPLLLIVLAFLSSADMMFSYYVTEFFSSINILDNLNISEGVSHSIIIFLVTIYFFSLIWGISERKEPSGYSGSEFTISSVTISIPLSLLNFVYLLFSIVQFSYLYGGAELRLPADYTYAEYARRGFFELVAVTVINFSIILMGINKTRSSSEKANSICKILYTLLSIFTLNMLYSAHYKMRLYESVYGYTYLRVYVHLFMVLLLILCLTALTSIWYKSINLPKIFILGSLTFYTVLNVINVDGFIAKQNIEIYRQKGKIDIHYLTTLSDDAVPYLIELTNDSSDELSTTVKANLDERKQNYEYSQESNSFLKFNISKSRARRLLN